MTPTTPPPLYALRRAKAPYPLHATVAVTGVVGWKVEGRRGLSAGQGEIVLAAELHLPHHLCLQSPIQMAAVLQALPPPPLCTVTVFAHSKPIGRTPREKRNFNSFSFSFGIGRNLRQLSKDNGNCNISYTVRVQTISGFKWCLIFVPHSHSLRPVIYLT